MPDTVELEKKNTSPILELLPGSDVMGKAYDETGEYARSVSVIDQDLFNFPTDLESIKINNHTYNHNSLLNAQTLFSSELQTIYGESVEEYHKDFSQQIGVDASYELFSGSINTAFGSETGGLTHTSYTSVKEIQRLWILSLPASRELKSFLKPQIQQDLDDSSLLANTVFDRYGAQYIGEAIIGGRIDYHASTKRLKTRNIDNFALVAAASYHSITGSGSVNSSTKRSSSVNEFHDTSNRRLESIGGEPGLDDAIFNGNNEAYSRWAKSLQDYAVLVDFTKKSLRPIWEFASDPERQKQLEEAYPQWLKSKEGKGITSNKKAIEADFNPPMKSGGTDSGSGAKVDFSVFYPSTSGKFYWSGQQGQTNHNQSAESGAPIFRDLYDLGLIKKPDDFELIWSDAGSGHKRDFSCWRALPPHGYRVLGDIMILGRKSNPKNETDRGQQFNRFMCVHESLCRDIRKKDLEHLWTDKGSGANDNLVLYKIKHLHSARTFFGRNVEHYDDSVNDTWIRKHLSHMGILRRSVIR